MCGVLCTPEKRTAYTIILGSSSQMQIFHSQCSRVIWIWNCNVRVMKIVVYPHFSNTPSFMLCSRSVQSSPSTEPFRDLFFPAGNRINCTISRDPDQHLEILFCITIHSNCSCLLVRLKFLLFSELWLNSRWQFQIKIFPFAFCLFFIAVFFFFYITSVVDLGISSFPYTVIFLPYRQTYRIRWKVKALSWNMNHVHLFSLKMGFWNRYF